MEHILQEPLTRAHILKILEQRRLKINNIYSISTEELSEIYKSFAIPLERRINCKRQANRLEYDINQLTDKKIPMETDDTCAKFYASINCIDATEQEQAKKRAANDDYNEMNLFADAMLVTATKRIKIDWP